MVPAGPLAGPGSRHGPPARTSVARLEHDARSILTTWGERKASEGAELHDYGNKDWAGLTADYYLPRWKRYFDSLDTALRTGRPPQPIDWYAMGDAWNHGHQALSDRAARGRLDAIASEVARTLRTDAMQHLVPGRER